VVLQTDRTVAIADVYLKYSGVPYFSTTGAVKSVTTFGGVRRLDSVLNIRYNDDISEVTYNDQLISVKKLDDGVCKKYSEDRTLLVNQLEIPSGQFCYQKTLWVYIEEFIPPRGMIATLAEKEVPVWVRLGSSGETLFAVGDLKLAVTSHELRSGKCVGGAVDEKIVADEQPAPEKISDLDDRANSLVQEAATLCYQTEEPLHIRVVLVIISSDGMVMADRYEKVNSAEYFSSTGFTQSSPVDDSGYRRLVLEGVFYHEPASVYQVEY
jgi:hypothetical protein